MGEVWGWSDYAQGEVKKGKECKEGREGDGEGEGRSTDVNRREVNEDAEEGEREKGDKWGRER